MAIAFPLHLLAATLWVGGMFFALVVLRPAALPLEMPLRVGLWSRVLERFMVVVWGTVLILPLTGYWMIFEGFGGMTGAGRHIRIMEGIGWCMILLFLLLFFRAFRPMQRMARELLIPETGLYIERIRKIVRINLLLGLIIFGVAGAGRYW
ncbi:MAG: CopD family protein [Magnetococcales bacterium]|nr:CopD family protein [Magnetococcales bacterium]